MPRSLIRNGQVLDGGFLSEVEMTTISGDLSFEIDTDIATHEAGSSHDSRYYTETELDTGQLDNRYYTEAEVNSLTWTESVITDLDKYTKSQVDTISGSLQTEINTKVNTYDYEDSDVLTKIKNVDGAGSGLDADTVDGYHASSLMGGSRNKIINGNFDIWQRGTSQTTSSYGSDDRWYNKHLGATKTHSQQVFTIGQSDVPGNPKYFSRTVVSSIAGAGNYCFKAQK